MKSVTKKTERNIGTPGFFKSMPGMYICFRGMASTGEAKPPSPLPPPPPVMSAMKPLKNSSSIHASCWFMKKRERKAMGLYRTRNVRSGIL